MNATPDYTVTVGRIARTLLYKDARGTVLFTFDVDSSKGQNKIILEWPSKSLIEAEQMRIDLARERIKKYLMARGYEVEDWRR
jgi:hypothetical protein